MNLSLCRDTRTSRLQTRSTLNKIHRYTKRNNIQLRSIVMVNAGGTIDLLEILNVPKDVSIYVLDSHRPLNLHNLFTHEQVHDSINSH